MPRKTAQPPVFDKSRNRWRVTIPASLQPNGKRVRSWHLTRDAARDYLAGIVSGPEPSAIIPPALAMKADEARLILEPLDLDLVEGAKLLRQVFAALAGTGTPLEAAKAWQVAHAARLASVTMGAAIPLFLATRDNLRDATVRGYKHHLNRALEPLHEMILADITISDVNAALAPRPPSVRHAVQVTLGTFWRWCAISTRGWCDVKVLESLEPVRLDHDTEISCLTPEQARAVLSGAEATSPGCAVGFAVAIFAGVRQRELEKLTWSAISADHIEIDASVAKRHSRRLIPICPTLRSWLDEHRGEAELDDLIVGPNWINTSKTARRRAGWDLKLQHPPKGVLPPITRGAWPKNVNRHTCASVQIAIGTPLDDLTFKFGHSGGAVLLKQHYLGKITKKDALAILAIGPKGVRIPNIQAA